MEEEFSAVGVDRLIPVRFFRLKASSGDTSLTLETAQYAIGEVNFVFRPAGVQFYIKAIDEEVTPLLSDVTRFDSGGMPIVTQWSAIRSQIQKVLPDVPDNEYANTQPEMRQDWIHLTSSRWAPINEILVWVSNSATWSQGIEPWMGRGFSTVVGDLQSPTNFAHEMGHYLGLPHPHELPNDPWSNQIPDPETGGVNSIDEYWDLIYAAEQPPVFFNTRDEAVAYPYSKSRKHLIESSGAQNCTWNEPTCTVTCNLLGFSNNLPFIHSNFYSTGSPALAGFALTFGGDAPPTYRRGINVVAYQGGPGCLNGIGTSYVRQVRKYLRYKMSQLPGSAWVRGGSPARTFRETLGMATGREPTYKLDFDGDGKRDIGVYQPPTTVGGTGKFVVSLSSNAYSSNTSLQLRKNFGTLGDVPVPADYDGDGITDLAVWRTSGLSGTDPTDNKAYWIFCSSRLNHACVSSVSVTIGGVPTTIPTTIQFGARQDIPLPGTNFDADGVTGEIAFYRPRDRKFAWKIAPFSGAHSEVFMNTGEKNAMPMLGLYDSGDSETDLVLYAPDAKTFYYRLASNNYATETARQFAGPFGNNTSPYPVVRRADVGGSSRRVFSLFNADIGYHHTMWGGISSSTVSTCDFGLRGDIALSGHIDRNNDGRSDLVIHRPRPDGTVSFYFTSGSCGSYTGRTANVSTRARFFIGQDATGDGKAEVWALDPDTMTWTYWSSNSDYNNPPVSIQLGEAKDIPL